MTKKETTMKIGMWYKIIFIQDIIVVLYNNNNMVEVKKYLINDSCNCMYLGTTNNMSDIKIGHNVCTIPTHTFKSFLL